jgi:hypothetical protein
LREGSSPRIRRSSIPPVYTNIPVSEIHFER